ncbi:hypothetical protein [Bacillus mycoides]|uniref:hypothetical protein n=1 Tax=Bacillus mycoides TaxID=1405 RepID=UPI001F134BA9|nr:hypothetical protein [Bacillus mycoides]
MKSFAELHTNITEVISKSLEPLRNIDWRDFGRLEKEAAELLGRRGWTFSINMSFSEVIKLSKINDQNERDSLFQNFYSKDEEYQYIKSEILKNKLFSEWKDLSIQCFDNYEEGNYLIVIPIYILLLKFLLIYLYHQGMKNILIQTKRQESLL